MSSLPIAPPSSLPAPPGPGLLASSQHSPPPDKSNRRSATLFRCWRCKMMVECDPSGACPRCGTPAPRVASAPLPVVGQSSRQWIVAASAIAAIAVVGALFVPRLVERMHHPSQAVAGEYRSTHLGVRLVFPDGSDGSGAPGGWRHLREGDRAPSATLGPLADLVGDALSLRSARFFRGSVGNPDAELYFVVAARAPSVTEASLGAWAQANAETPGRIADPTRELTGVDNLQLFKCAAGAGVPHGGLRCTGTVHHTAAVLIVWTVRNDLDVTLFLSGGGPEAALAESSEIMAGLDSGP